MPQSYLTVREAADRLSVTERTIYELLWGGRIDGAIRVGRAIRIPDSALDQLPRYTVAHAKRE